MTGFQKSNAQKSGALALLLGFLLCGAAFATPFTLTAQLTGDPRPGNPDNLIIDVTASGDTTSTSVAWKVEINSPAHPDAKLDEFYGNLALPLGYGVGFSAFTPSDWQADAASPVGGGSINFSFEVFNAFPGGTGDDVTSAQPLMFTMTLLPLAGFPDPTGFDPAILTEALASCSSDDELGCGQLGAHLQSLVAVGEESDSGFLLGNWDDGSPPQGAPEPGSLALLGAALFGLAAFRRRRKS